MRAITRCLGRGAVDDLAGTAAHRKREVTVCLRTDRALRARTRGRSCMFVTDQVMIGQRPAEADDRAVPGHWEGALIMELSRSAIGTLVERTTRCTMLLCLPPKDGHGVEPRTKNGPPPAGDGVQAVREAIADALTTWSERLG